MSLSIHHWLARSLLLCLLVAALPATSATAQTQTQVRLLLDRSETTPGSTLDAALELTMATGWHTYWRNPSESDGIGMATRIRWSLPPGVTADPILWPVPLLKEEAAGITHVFEETVLLVVPLHVASNAPPGEIELVGRVSWLECLEECVPGQTEVRARLRIGEKVAQSADAPKIAQARTLLPPRDPQPKAVARWEGEPTGKDRALLIDWTTTAVAADFYALENSEALVLAKTERPEGAPAGLLRIRKKVNQGESGWPTKVTGLLVAEPNTPGRKGFEVELAIQPPSREPETPAVPFSWAALVPMLGAALLGGLILNIMPCVLPVIALKVLSFVRQSGSNPVRVRKLGLVYGLGVLASFLVLALVLLGLQAAGKDANWSTAFQSPTFRVLLCILMVLVSLNLFGVFEVALEGKAITSATEIIRREGPGAAFFNGVLAAVLATPCTAPFLATAVAFAFTQPPLVLILIFLTVGLGLALPFVLLCWQPAWLKLLPKPGDWMVRFKVAMGFPMLGTAIWIFWFTATRMGGSGVLWFGLFLVVVSAAAWAWGEFAQRAGRPLAGGLTQPSPSSTGRYTSASWRDRPRLAHPGLPAPAQRSPGSPGPPAAVAAARAAGHPVLVDFTADNCANCKFNLVRSIEIAPTLDRLTQGRLRRHSPATSPTPTRRSPPNSSRYNRRGVPLVLVYPEGSQPRPARPPHGLHTRRDPRAALDWATR
jgi:DsbC/DsbD-like thiol-disulfide interchange protein/cytochrome c biogenesis protein CcdA